jgi:hypothetical protein
MSACRSAPTPCTLTCPISGRRYLAYRCPDCSRQVVKHKGGYQHTHDRIFLREVAKE